MKETLNFLKDEAQANKLTRENRDLKRDKRNQAPVRTPCDTVGTTFDEFIFFIEGSLLNANSYTSMRRKAAIIIMYFTGLRISSLLSFKVHNFQEMISTTNYTLIDYKVVPTPRKILISPLARTILKKHAKAFHRICKDKKKSRVPPYLRRIRYLISPFIQLPLLKILTTFWLKLP
jgi:hypothetical protein